MEIIEIRQIDSNAIKLSWKINETIENSVSSIQLQYRFIHPKTSWIATNDLYNRSVSQAMINNLQRGQTYKIRLVGFDVNGKQLVISAAKRITLDSMKNQANLILPQITEAWVTNEGHISLRWKVSETSH